MAEVPDCPACGTAGLMSFSAENLYCCAFCGSWVETNRETKAVYDSEYVASRYDRYPTTEKMSWLRLSIMEHVIWLYETMAREEADNFQHGHPLYQPIHGRLLDVGFGNGSFIRMALKAGWDAYGYDVNPTEYPEVRRAPLPIDSPVVTERYRVVTFFDTLEHFEDLLWAPKLARNTDWIVVSVPRTPDHFPEVVWKHRRPGEHHFHFSGPCTLEDLFSSDDTRATCVYVDNPEDVIRGPLSSGEPNIMTCCLRCQPASTPYWRRA